MLELVVPGQEYLNAETNEFIYTNEQKICLEHSLISISKWESKWHKSFLSSGPSNKEEWIDYIRCMTLTQKVSPDTYVAFYTTPGLFNAVIDYIKDPMTASSVTDRNPNKPVPKKQIITSELIYYWMIVREIPFECEKWHINRLLMLMKIYDAKNSNTKMSRKDTLNEYRAINAARRAAGKSKG